MLINDFWEILINNSRNVYLRFGIKNIKTSHYIFILFFLIPNIYISQTTIPGKDTLNKTDEAGLKQGYWKKFKENEGKQYLAEEGRYHDNKKKGSWIEYYGNGKKKNVLEFKEGKPHGKAIMYFNNGTISESGQWESGKWVGDYYKFYECNGKVYQKFHFNQTGKRDGLQKYYYSNGNLYMEVNFKSGKEEGEGFYFNFHGKLIGKLHFLDGVETQVSKDNNKNLNPDRLKQQADSLEKDCGKEKPSNRKLRASFSLSGYQTLYNKNKQITKEGIFIDNRLIEGKAYYYDDSGKLIRISIYKDEQYLEDE